MTDPDPKLRWFHLTPGRFVLALLAVEVLLWLSERFGWLGWHKGYAVLTGLAVVGVAMVVMLVWFGVALIFRWRFQFSIRSLLVLVMVVAVPFSWLAVEIRAAREQKAVVKEIRERHGRAHYDYQGDKYDVRQSGPCEPSWFSDLFGEDFCHEVRWVEELSLDTTDEDLARIARQFPHLRRIDLNFCRITDAGLRHVAALRELEAIELDNTPVSDVGLQHLQALRRLRELTLQGTRVTDVGLSHLEELTELEDLSLGYTRVSDAGLQHLRPLRRLKRLLLYDTQITDTGLAYLKGLDELEEIQLDDTRVTEKGIKNLQKLLPKTVIQWEKYHRPIPDVPEI